MSNTRGAALMILSMACFAVEDSVIKTVTQHVPPGQVLLYLGSGGALAFGLLANRRGYCPMTRGFLHPAVVTRNLGEIVGTAGYVTALTLIPLSLASALLQALPLFVTLGAILFLGARVGWRRWLALGLGLVGVLLILRPGLEGWRPEALIGLFATLGMAARDVATRRVPATTHPLQLAGWGFLMLVPIGATLLALSGGAVRPSGPELGLIGVALGLGMVGYYALTRAMQLGDMAFVTPFRYTRLIFGLGLAWALFAERPDALMLAGAALVVGTGLFTLWRERRAPRVSGPPTA